MEWNHDAQSDDGLLKALGNLSRHDLDRTGTERIRAMSHAVLRRQRTRIVPDEAALAVFVRNRLEPLSVTAFATLYLLWAFGRSALLLLRAAY